MEQAQEQNDHQWKEKLTDEQYRVMRQCGTEAPFSGEWYAHKENGMYVCAACGQELFSSETKFDSGTGWPSFSDVAKSDAVTLKDDDSLGIDRVEVQCSRCGGHLGHLFNDGPTPTGQRYCMNSVSLGFEPQPSKND